MVYYAHEIDSDRHCRLRGAAEGWADLRGQDRVFPSVDHGPKSSLFLLCADIVAEHPCGVYIFELKLDESAAAALEQVKAKNYDAPYRAKGLPIYAVGLSFDSKTRQLADAEAVVL